jgi:hypothetical protein
MIRRSYALLFVAIIFAFFELNCGGGATPASKSSTNNASNQTPSSSGSGSGTSGSNPSGGGTNGSGSSGSGGGTSGSGGNPSGGGTGGSGGNDPSGGGSGGNNPSGGGNQPQGTTMYNLHQQSGWNGYGELPPSYMPCCSPGGPDVTWSMQQKISSPSMSGNSTEFSIGGKEAYSDVLWNNHLIGQGSSQNLPDPNGTLNEATHNFVYDVYFYGTDFSNVQALEFDINQFVDGKSFVWGHQCRVADGANWWDISIDGGAHWQPTGNAPCNPKVNDWNHLTIQVQRTSDDQLLFQTITLNGVTATLNYQEEPGDTNWKGITINYQQDGDYDQQSYSIWLDQLNFSYW